MSAIACTTGQSLLGEGARWDGRRDELLRVDLLAGRMFRDRIAPDGDLDPVCVYDFPTTVGAVAPIEGHAILVEPTDAGLTCWIATQHPHDSRDLICKYTGLPPDSVRVIAPHVSGAFGGKAGIFAEHAAVISAARRVGRPVSWAETRSEAMLSMHGRGQVQYA